MIVAICVVSIVYLMLYNTIVMPPSEGNSILLATNARDQTVTENIGPVAYYYDDYTYYAYQASSSYCDPFVGKYQHTIGIVTPGVKVANGVLVNDGHGAPCIIRDMQGYIHVFFGAHYSALKHSKSNNPDDISSWTAQDDIGDQITYPWVLQVGLTFYLFYRYGEWMECYRTSTDNMATFSSGRNLIDGEWSYSIYHGNYEYDASTGRIYFVWLYRVGFTATFINGYCAYMRVSDQHLFSMSDFDLGTTIDFSEAEAYCKFLDYVSPVVPGVNGQQLAHMPFANIHLDPTAQTPYIIFCVDGYKFIKWTEATWSKPVTIYTLPSTTPYWFQYEDFIISSSGRISDYLCDSNGDISQFISTDGGLSWSFSEKYCRSSSVDSMIVRVVQGFHAPFRVLAGEQVRGDPFNLETNVHLYGLS